MGGEDVFSKKKDKVSLLLFCMVHSGGEFIDFDDVSAAVDGFWSGCRGLSLICRLCHMSDIQNWN